MADENRVAVEILVTPKGLEFIDQAGRKVGELGRAAKDAEQSFSLFSAKGAAAAVAVGGLATAVTGFAIAAGAARAGIDAFTAGVARGSALNDLSQRLGVSVETLSKLELAAKTSGVSLDGLGVGIQQLSRNMVEAASGGKEAQAAFAALGISVAELKNLNTEQVLGKIADSFAGANDGAAKTALAMQLLGRGGAQLIPLLNEGSDGLQRFSELSERLGLTMTRDMASAFDSIGDSMDILGSAVAGVQSQFAIGMAPALAEVSQALEALVADMGIANGTIRSLGEDVGGWLKQAFESLRGTIEETQGLFATLDFDDAMGIVGERLNTALESAFESAIWAAARAAKNVFTTAVEWAFGSVDISSVVASKNEALIREQVGNLERELNARYGAGGLEAARADAPFDANIRNLVENVDALKGRLGELAGAQLVADAAAAKHSNSMLEQDIATKLAEIGITDAAAAWRFYENAGVSAGKTNLAAPLKDTGDAAKKAADEIAKLSEQFGQQVSSIEGNIRALEFQGDALDAIIDGNLGAAEAQDELNDALQRAAEEAAIAAGFDRERARLLGELARLHAEEAQEIRAKNAINAQRLEVSSLQAQIPLMRQAISGAITRADAERQIAIILEKIKLEQAGVTEGVDELAAKAVDARDEFEKVSAEFEKIGDAGEDAWKGINDAFDQTLDGLINGTLEMQDIWQSFTLGLLKDFADSMGGVEGIFGKVVGGFRGLFTGDAGLKDKDGNPISFLEGIGGGTDRFLVDKKDEFGNVVYGPDGKPEQVTDYGAVAGAAAQGGITAYSMFQATTDTKLEGLIAKGTERGVLSAANGIGQAVGTAVGAVASIWLGPLGGILGGVVGSGFSALIAGSVDRDTFRTGEYKGFVGIGQDAYKVGGLSHAALAGIPLAQEAAFTSALLIDAILNLPTLGLAMRKGGESVLDESETFGAAQSRFGDITVRSGGPRGVYRNNLTGADTARARGFTDEQVELTLGATASIFNQIADGEMAEDAGRLGEAMGQIMAEFLSRGLEEGVEFEEMFDLLRQFAHEAGIDIFTSMGALEDVLNNSMAAAQEWGKLDPMAAATQGARAYAESLVGATEVFRNDFPAGVNLTAVALRNLEKDGVNAFGEIDDEAKDTLLNLAGDTQLTMDTIQKLVEQGFRIDVEQFERQLEAISGSATFIGANIGEAFSGPSVFAGIEAIGVKLKEAIKGDLFATATEQLFDKTRIAESFTGVFEVLGKLREGDFDLTDAVGAESFKNQMVLAISTGKASLQEYIPQLRAIRDAAEEIDEAIEEALKPTEAEAFWANLSETFESNKDAINGMAEAMFEVAVQAERAGSGLGQQATRDAMAAKIDEGIFTATQAAVSTTAGESPEAKRLAELTTEFQFKVQAALKDGVVTGAELADLTRLKAKMHEAGQQVADGIAEGTEALGPLFRADRLAENIAAATASLSDSVGSGAGSMFDVIKEGGSTAEGVKAFGESFRGSVRDNILQGMQEALVQSAIMEGALGTLMGQLKSAVSVALEDGFIDADEQAFIDGLAKGIGTATDQTLQQLQPTLETLGGIAQTVAGNTDKAEVKIGELDRSTKNASYGVDEMARRAAKSLEEVGDAVPPATVGALKDGLGALGDAFGDVGTGPATAIKDGMGALQDAFGGVGGAAPAADIKNGLTALRDAFGPEASPDQIGEGLEKIKAALDAAQTDPIAQGIGAIRGALGGETGGGITDAASALIESLNGTGGLSGIADTLTAQLGTAGAAGAADEAAAKLRDQLQPATDDVAGALRSGFLDGLNQAEAAARKLADALSGVGAIPGRANGGPVPAGTMAFVGERGPELILAHPGGGVSVVPLDDVPGYADGTGDYIGISPRGTGPFGRPKVPPPPAPRRQSESTDDTELKVTLSIEAHLEEFFRTGDFTSFSEQFEQSVNESVAQGIMSAILETGPLKAAMDKFNSVLSHEIEQAWSDGSLSDEELAKIRAKMAELGGPIKDIVKTLGPEIGALFADLGLDDSVGSDLRSALGSAFREFATSGDLDSAKDAVRQAFNEATMNGIVDALLLEGPIADAIESASTGFSDAMRDALADGVISEEEAERLRELGADLGSDLETAFAGLDPAIAALFDGMRDKAAESMANAGELIGGSLNGLLNDPANLNFDAFSQALRGNIYASVAGGLIDAFVESAVTQGALAPMLGAIQVIFDQIGQKQLTIAEANGLIAEQMAAINNVLLDPTFKSAIESLLSGIKDIGQNLNAFPPAAAAAASAAGDVSDAVTTAREDVCDGQCALTQEVVDMGAAALGEFGRSGYEEIERWVSQGGGHGVDPALLPDTLGGDPDGRYGWLGSDADRRRAARSQRRRDRLDGANDGPDGEYGYYGPGYRKMAAGGVVTEPTFALIGEAGPEAVIPLEQLRNRFSSSLDFAFSPPPSVLTDGDAETKSLLREIATLLRSTRDVGTADGAKLDKLADAIRSQPLVIEGRVELDGRELAKSTLSTMRRMSRGSQSVTAGIS